MTKVIQLGRGYNNEEDIASIYNHFTDNEESGVVSAWSNLYESNEDIEDQNKEHLKIIIKYLRELDLNRSANHIEKTIKEELK